MNAAYLLRLEVSNRWTYCSIMEFNEQFEQAG